MNVRAKGSAGEREFCSWLKKNFSIDTERNLDQVREGGSDIIWDRFAFEIKRVENPDLESFWLQAKGECDGKTPIVAFRRNRHKWSFLIGPENIGCKHGFLQLKEETFKEWFKNEITR